MDIYISTDTSTHNHVYLQISTNIYTQLYIQVPGGGRELLQPGDGGAGGGGHPAPLHPGRGHGEGGVRGGGGGAPWTLLDTALPCDHLHATVRSATMNKYLSHRLVFVFLPPSLLCHIVMTPYGYGFRYNTRPGNAARNVVSDWVNSPRYDCVRVK